LDVHVQFQWGGVLDGCDRHDVFLGVQLLLVLSPSLHLLATVLDDVPGEGFQGRYLNGTGTEGFFSFP